jgi:hypothetical protein
LLHIQDRIVAREFFIQLLGVAVGEIEGWWGNVGTLVAKASNDNGIPIREGKVAGGKAFGDAGLNQGLINLTKGLLDSCHQALVAEGSGLVQGRFCVAVLAEMGQDQGENNFTVGRALNGVIHFVADLGNELALDFRVAVDSSVVAKQETTALEGVAVGLTDPGSGGRSAHVSDDAIARRGHADLLQIDIVPGRLGVLENGSAGFFVQEDVDAEMRPSGNVGVVPANSETVAVHVVIVNVTEFWMEGRIFRQLHQRVAGGQDNVGQRDWLGRQQRDPTAHLGRIVSSLTSLSKICKHEQCEQ